MKTPLILSQRVATRIQVVVEGIGEDGERELSIYSCPEDAEPGHAWTQHAEFTGKKWR